MVLQEPISALQALQPLQPLPGLDARSPEQSKRILVTQILGPSGGRRLVPDRIPGALDPEVQSIQVVDTVPTEEAWRQAKLFGHFDAKAKSAWSLEFEADALAAQSECRFLQAEVHRLLAQRAADQVTTGRTIAELEATVAALQAERDRERAQMRDARMNVEVATLQLSEGYDLKLKEFKADRDELADQAQQLELEIRSLHESHLQDFLAFRRWHCDSLELILISPQMLRCAFQGWRQLSAAQAQQLQRRALVRRALHAATAHSPMLQKRAALAAWRSALLARHKAQAAQRALQASQERHAFGAAQVLRRSCFWNWKLQAIRPVQEVPWALARARERAARPCDRGPDLRSCWETWAAAAREAQHLRAREQLEAQTQELLAQCSTQAAQQMQVLESSCQEREQLAEEVFARQLTAQKLECAKLESRLTVAEAQRAELRTGLAAAEAAAAAAARGSEERAAALAAQECQQLAMRREEAAVAGRLARVSQQASEWEEEVQELRISLQAERAAVAVLRQDLSSHDLMRPALSLPAEKLRPGLDEVAKRWRLEHSHSVSAIHKSGSLPESITGSRRLRIEDLED